MSRQLVILGVPVLVAEEDVDRLTGRIEGLRLSGPQQWVLVKGWHDQGGVEGVYGPYSEAHADWLLGSLLDCSSYNWTKAKLDSGPLA